MAKIGIKQINNSPASEGSIVVYDGNKNAWTNNSVNSILIPSGTTAQRPAIPVNGHIRYDTDNNQIDFYENGSWRTFTTPGEINTAANVGIGSDIFRDKTGVTLNLRSIIGGANITATQNANDITLDVNGIPVTIDDLNDVDTITTPPASGQVLQWDGTNWVPTTPSASGSTTDLATVQVRHSSDIPLLGSFTNILFDITDIENDDTVLEHNITNADRIDIKETGLYMVSLSASIDADSGEEIFEVRVLINDITVIPGSVRKISEDDEINDVGGTFYAELTAGDYITFQFQASGAGNVLINQSVYNIVRVKGTKGQDGLPGPTGAGSNVNVSDEGSLVTGGPFNDINFIGSNVTVTDGGSGSATVTINSIGSNIFGTEFHDAENEIVSTTNSQNWIQKLKLTTGSIPAGTYRIGWSYQWNHDRVTNDFEGRVEIDDTTTIMFHKQEPKDSSGTGGSSGTNQAHQLSGFKNIVLTSGIHTIDIDYRTSDVSDESSIWNARLELWRVA